MLLKKLSDLVLRNTHAKIDNDLNNIRKDKKFTALLEGLKQYDKLTLLQNAGNYQNENIGLLPVFTYQSAENDNLKEVRKYFNLTRLQAMATKFRRYWTCCSLQPKSSGTTALTGLCANLTLSTCTIITRQRERGLIAGRRRWFLTKCISQWVSSRVM